MATALNGSPMGFPLISSITSPFLNPIFWNTDPGSRFRSCIPPAPISRSEERGTMRALDLAKRRSASATCMSRRLTLINLVSSSNRGATSSFLDLAPPPMLKTKDSPSSWMMILSFRMSVINPPKIDSPILNTVCVWRSLSSIMARAYFLSPTTVPRSENFS